jgi:putative ABC transport system ATP-binding protein
MALVSLEGVSRSYDLGEVTVNALADVSLSIEEAGFAALVGPSGSGKTTALNLIGCLDKPSQGRVLVAGQDVSKLGSKRRSRLSGAKTGLRVPGLQPAAGAHVAENVEYPLLHDPGHAQKPARPAVDRVLEAVGMATRRTSIPAQLSGGQKQRVAIARALVGDPSLVLADEPTANLDGATAHG